MRTRTEMKARFQPVIPDKLTNEHVHFLGFSIADGNVDKNCRGVFRLLLQRRDECLLEKYCDLFQIPKEDYISRFVNSGKWEQSYFYISNWNFVEWVSHYNIIPLKTYDMKFPTEEIKGFEKAFILGFMDGDGCIHVEKPYPIYRIKSHIQVAFASCSKEFLIELNEVIYCLIGFSGKLNMHKGNIPKNWRDCYCLVFKGLDAVKFLQWLYIDSSEIFLERKKKKFTDHLKMMTCDLREVGEFEKIRDIHKQYYDHIRFDSFFHGRLKRVRREYPDLVFKFNNYQYLCVRRSDKEQLLECLENKQNKQNHKET